MAKTQVTIVTIAMNHATGLTRTLESISQLAYSDCELILVIGESVDNTLEVAKNFVLDSQISTRIVIQQDPGIYQAMNLGIDIAAGEFIIFMNAGDQFASSFCLNNLAGELLHSKLGLVIGGYKLETNLTRSYIYRSKKISPIIFAFNRHGGCHQSILYRTETMRGLNGYDLNYSLVSDFDITLKIIIAFGGLRSKELVAIIEPGGIADRKILTVHREKHLVRKSNFNSRTITLISMVWTVLASLKVMLKK